MSTTIRPLAALNEEATAILVRELGVVDAMRFLTQFRTGAGDYTKERGQWLDKLSMDQVVSGIKAQRRSRAPAKKVPIQARIPGRNEAVIANSISGGVR